MNFTTFSEIYTQYYKSSFLFVMSYVRDDMIAEDIVSDSLIVLWQTLKKEQVDYPYTLLLTILKNNVLNHLKRRELRRTALETLSSKMVRELDFRITTLEACDPVEIFSTEITEIIEKTLSSLPTQTRLVFELSRYENLSVKEIAEKLAITPKGVEYHITKSLKALRVSLKEYLPALYLLVSL